MKPLWAAFLHTERSLRLICAELPLEAAFLHTEQFRPTSLRQETAGLMARRADYDARVDESPLGIGDRVLAEVENRCGEHRVGTGDEGAVHQSAGACPRPRSPPRECSQRRSLLG